MATRRVNPRLMAAFDAASIEPLDFDTPGRVIEVPYPAGEAPEAPPVNEGVKPRSRFDVVREYLEANRQPMPQPTTPEVDVRAAADSDARRNFGASMLAAGQAFSGNRRAVGQMQSSNAQETQALAEREARKRELEQWAAGRERQWMGEAGLLSSALVEPSRKDPELERERLENDRMRIEQTGKLGERKLTLEEEKFAAKGKGGKKAEGKTLPVSEVGELSSLPVAEQQVDRLAEEFKRLEMGGMGGRVGGALTDVTGARWTDSAEYQAAAKLAMQAAGKIMEGGKLAAGDEVKYAAMLPRAGDSDAVVQQKVSGMKDFLRSLAASRAKGLKESGYNVPPGLFPAAKPPEGGPKPTDGKVPMVSVATGATVLLSPAAAAAMEKAGKVKKP